MTFNLAKELVACVSALTSAGGELYEVGGPVRDHFLGLASKDHDILCRKLTVQQITNALRPIGKVATVGKAFGVVKFTPRDFPGIEIDIALPRKETSTGVHHRDFEVDFDPELKIEDDLGRRDFTVNAMALSLLTGEIIDPFNGQKDLSAKILRMVFPRAFEEDPLRLLRAVQFSARFNLQIEPKTLASMKANAELIKSVSGERISQELVKLMLAEKPSVGFKLMRDVGILKHVMPDLHAICGIEQDKQPGDDVFAHSMRVLDAARADEHIINRGDLDLLFAALLHDIGKSKTARNHPTDKRIVFFGHQIVSAKMAKRWLEKVKMASCGVNIDNVVHLIDNHMFETKSHYTDRAIRRFVAKIGPELIHKLMDLRLSDNRGGKHPSGIKGVLKLKKRIDEEMAKKPPFGAKDLAVNGHDLMAIGIPAGPQMGTLIKALVEVVLDEPEKNEKEILIALAKKLLEDGSIFEKAKSKQVTTDGEETTDEAKKTKPRKGNKA